MNTPNVDNIFWTTTFHDFDMYIFLVLETSFLEVILYFAQTKRTSIKADRFKTASQAN